MHRARPHNIRLSVRFTHGYSYFAASRRLNAAWAEICNLRFVAAWTASGRWQAGADICGSPIISTLVDASEFRLTCGVYTVSYKHGNRQAQPLEEFSRKRS